MMPRQIELLREPLPWSASELAERRRAARRTAWLIGLAALLLYGGGFFVSR